MTHCEIHKWREVADKIIPLIPEHYEEAIKENNHQEVDVDFDYYNALSDSGACVVVTLNEGNDVVGYSIFTLGNDPMRKNVNEATNTCLYVKKAFRGIGTKKMIDKSNAFLKKMGVDAVNYILKDSGLTRLLEKTGYSQEYRLWSAKI